MQDKITWLYHSYLEDISAPPSKSWVLSEKHSACGIQLRPMGLESEAPTPDKHAKGAWRNDPTLYILS